MQDRAAAMEAAAVLGEYGLEVDFGISTRVGGPKHGIRITVPGGRVIVLYATHDEDRWHDIPMFVEKVACDVCGEMVAGTCGCAS